MRIILIALLGMLYAGTLALDYTQQSNWGGSCSGSLSQSPIDVPDVTSTCNLNVIGALFLARTRIGLSDSSFLL